MAESQRTATSNATKCRHIVFLHLDLGIGGAEQLVINLALASLGIHNDANNDKGDKHDTKVSIITTHCDQNHCFDAVRIKTNGSLSQSVHVVGSFLPVTIFGYATAFCSTIRMLYISFMTKWLFTGNENSDDDADVFVVDVLPTPIPYLVSTGWKGFWNGNCGNAAKSVIFYCHFPDKLLTRDTVNGIPIQENNKRDGNVSMKRRLKRYYRQLLDTLEEWSMSYADLILVNSNFTKTEVMHAFPSLESSDSSNNTANSDDQDNNIEVLYPAIDLAKFIPPNFEQKQAQLLHQSSTSTSKTQETETILPIVSLNRFERKKNIELLLHSYAKLLSHISEQNSTTSTTKPPPLIISGGYDPRNTENVQYLEELKSLSTQLQIQDNITFLPSISDTKRAQLLQSALCVVYTPNREHFGIVPLEAMYAGSAVVALKSGGPMETVLDGTTGVLVECTDNNNDFGTVNTSSLEERMAKVLWDLVQHPEKAVTMGRRGHEHVSKRFGMGPFRDQWKQLVLEEAIPRGQYRRTEGGEDGGTEMKKKGRNSVGISLMIFGVLVSFWISSMLKQ